MEGEGGFFVCGGVIKMGFRDMGVYFRGNIVVWFRWDFYLRGGGF